MSDPLETELLLVVSSQQVVLGHNLGPLEEQVLLTTEPYPQPEIPVFNRELSLRKRNRRQVK